MLHKPALLALADGLILEGISVGASGTRVGELVFNTAMTGYQEILSDPSYARQIITLTTAHVGNTGCNTKDWESNKIWASGLVLRECSSHTKHYRAEMSFPDWLKKENVVAIAEIDTRRLTTHLREKGAIAACISTEPLKAEKALALAKAFQGLNGMDLASEVSRKTVERWDLGREEWGPGTSPMKFHLLVFDFGIKRNILRIFHDKGCHLTVVPAETSVQEVLALNPDGVLLSNGPGDPQSCTYAIENTAKFIEIGLPIFGICLGFQILGLSLGAQTLKMKFGHHGANHPVVEIAAPRRVFITSQNHGFALDESTLPEGLEPTHRSLFDGSLQGIKHQSKPILGFQGHPEASPGPHDIEVIFDEFLAMMQRHKELRKSL